jgi:hypothetical protein
LKLRQQNSYNRGEKANRNNPKCYSKQKEIQSGKKTFFSREHLSLESSYDLFGISEKTVNLLKVGTSADISTYGNISVNVSDIF